LNATYYITIRDILFGADISRSPSQSTWTFKLSGGRVATRTFDAYRPAPTEPAPLPVRWYSTEPLAGLTSGWRTLGVTSNTLPVPLRDYAANFRRIRLPNSCVVFLQLKAITDVDGQSLGAFLDDTERDLRSHPPCSVILDLRYSVGGDFTKIASFGRQLPELVAPNGKIYVLTTAMTFSASIATVGFIKQAAGARVSILGEPVGDRLAFFSEGNSGCLPNSHLCLDFATGKNDFTKLCLNPDTCFWLDWIYPIRVRTLAPDEVIPTSFAEWREGKDPVFDRALALATAKHQDVIRPIGQIQRP